MGGLVQVEELEGDVWDDEFGCWCSVLVGEGLSGGIE